MAIERIAYFGDSYCADAKMFYEDVEAKPFFWPQKSYIDYVYSVTNLPIVYRGRSGHGPNYTITEFMLWLEENKDLIPTTQFIWCWSDPARTLIKSPPGRSHIDMVTLESDPADFLHRKKDWFNPSHVGEMGEPGPDSTMLDEMINKYYEKPPLNELNKDTHEQLFKNDRRWAETFKLYYMYIRNETDQFRRFVANCKLFGYLIKDYDIKYIQNYRCFPSHVYRNRIGDDRENIDLKLFEEQTEKYLPEHEFIYKGKLYDNLFEFARIEEFGYNKDGNEKNYPNHFSYHGQKAFAHIIYERMKYHL